MENKNNKPTEVNVNSKGTEITLKELERARAELLLLYEVSNAMRTTLELEQILYIILTAITSHEGLGFNRAVLFLVNDKEKILEGKMGIGPHSIEEATSIWKGIEESKMVLEDLINAYDNFKRDPNSRLHNLVKGIRVPLNESQGILALTALEGMPFEVITEESRLQSEDKYLQILGTKYFVTAPLKAKDKVVGVVLADNIFTQKPITKADVGMLDLFANHAGLAIENSRLYEETVYLSNTDWLTKLWNHGHFQVALANEIARAREADTPLSLLMIDIDDFKHYNDKFGHVAGDFIIKEMARVLAEASRKKDYVCRYGGEEFAVILPQTTTEDASHIAHRLREKVTQHNFPNQEAQPKKVFTFSCGLSTFPKDAADKDTLIKNADSALYKAKKCGKDQIVLYE
ncbi:MAG: sensor domain-containing diguanylate cyclase [Candidatus Omnitrophica bacterium]|nr:sensor domain-containing diguanylate cyclase [Candidatus Omnitrophota bacterium]